MKTKTLLLIMALLISVGLNVYSFNSGEQEVSPCDDSQRYNDEVAGGGMEMSVSDLKYMVTNYKNSQKDERSPYKTTGFILSKKVCDELFKNPTNNALSMDMFVKDGQLNLAIRGIHTTHSAIDAKTGSNHFVIQTFCPSDCSVW